MRFVMKVSIPVDKFDTAVRDGSAGTKLQQILDDTKPEAVCFWEEDGERGGIMVVSLEKASQIPAFAEPRFLSFDANVAFHPPWHDTAGSRCDASGRARKEVCSLECLSPRSTFQFDEGREAGGLESGR